MLFGYSTIETVSVLSPTAVTVKISPAVKVTFLFKVIAVILGLVPVTLNICVSLGTPAPVTKLPTSTTPVATVIAIEVGLIVEPVSVIVKVPFCKLNKYFSLIPTL